MLNKTKWTQGAALCVALAMGAAGCASTPIPNEKIAVAKSSVARAEQSGAPEYAPVEMAAALHVHPQTARYRAARVRKLLGDQLDDPDARFELEIALRAG